MTTAELQSDWQYLYDERLGILGCYAGQEPTDAQDRIARREANEGWDEMDKTKLK